MDIDLDLETASTSSSSPDPLGQPDLSSPLTRTPQDRSRSRPRARASLRHEILRSPTPAPRPSSSRRSSSRTTPAPAPAHVDGMPPQRRSPRGRAVRERAEAAPEEEGPLLNMTGDDPSSSPGSPSQSFLGEATTVTIPLKTGDETPRRGNKRRPGTPRRRGTPIARRDAEERIYDIPQSSDVEEETAGKAKDVSPQRTQGPGRPGRTPKRTAHGKIFGPPLDTGAIRPTQAKTARVPGGSPGKRRKIVSDDRDNFTFTITNHKAGPLKENDASSDKPRADTRSPPHKTTTATDDLLSLSLATPIASSAHLQASPELVAKSSEKIELSMDPTDEHDGFDTIVESEDFTRVSLSSIPSGQYLRSLTGSRPDDGVDKPTNGGASAKRRSHDLLTPSDSSQAAVGEQHPDRSLVQEPSTSDSGHLAGFGTGSKRAMRDALRLGTRLAKQRLEAKKASAAVEDATANVWAELADEETSAASTLADSISLSQNANAFARNNAVAAFPDDQPSEINYPDLPKQQPTPDRSDDHDNNTDAGNEMSWRYDTPAKAAFKLPQNVGSSNVQAPQSTSKTPPVPAWTSSPPTAHQSSPQNRVANFNSSPDKQLFLEQAAYDLEVEQSSRADLENGVHEAEDIDMADEDDDEDDEHESIYRDGNADAPIVIDSGDVVSDVDGDSETSDEPPELSEVTKSLLADEGTDETDIWAEEAQASMDQSGLEQEAVCSSPRASQSNIKPAQSRQGEPISSPSQIISPSTTRGDLTMRGALPLPHVQPAPLLPVKEDPPLPQIPKEPEELYPPKRGKLMSLWRRQDGSSPVVYSDEVELPPSEEAAGLQRPQRPSALGKRKLVTPLDVRKKTKYNDSDISVLSEFKNVVPIKRDPVRESLPPTSPTKQVRFASEDPDHPYLPTTPVQSRLEILRDEEEEEEEHGDEDEHCVDDDDDDEEVASQTDKGRCFVDEEDDAEDEDSELDPRPSPKRRRTKSPESIAWEEKTPPKKSSWLTGWLPSWFKTPTEPIFSFSFPRFASSTSAQQLPSPTPSRSSSPEYYVPTAPSGPFSTADHLALCAISDRAKASSLPAPESADILSLLGCEITSYGWKKRINAWELGIIEEFLQDTERDERFTPEQVAMQLFGIWATEVQEGKTGLGKGVAGLFSKDFVEGREKVLARAKRMRSLAAS